MMNMQNLWPFGLDRRRFPAFFAAAAVILVILAFCDGPVAQWVINLPHVVRAPFGFITRAGNSDWILIPTLAGTVLGFAASKIISNDQLRLRARTFAAVSAFAFIGVAGPGTLANLIKRLIGRARPISFEELGAFHFEPVMNGWTFQSFPSGDATTIFALAMVVGFFLPRLMGLLLAGALLVALSRIMVGVHFPTDVFGGILLGSFGAFFVRNVAAHRGWLFEKDADGKIHPRLKW